MTASSPGPPNARSLADRLQTAVGNAARAAQAAQDAAKALATSPSPPEPPAAGSVALSPK